MRVTHMNRVLVFVEVQVIKHKQASRINPIRVASRIKFEYPLFEYPVGALNWEPCSTSSRPQLPTTCRGRQRPSKRGKPEPWLPKSCPHKETWRTLDLKNDAWRGCSRAVPLFQVFELKLVN
jgi:hypothetical protein